MIPSVSSPIAKSAINVEIAKEIINGILDIFKEVSSTLDSPYMYYYYFDRDEKPLINSFEEKSAAQLVCLYSNLGIHTSCVLLFLLCIVHKAYYHFFATKIEFRDSLIWINWLQKFVERDQKVGNSWTKTLAVDTPLSPSTLTRRGKLIKLDKAVTEIYTLENFWEIIHSRDYR